MSDMLATEIADLRRRLKVLEGIEAPLNWGNVIGQHLALPQLRGFWPMNSTDSSLNVYDLSGQGRTLTRTNAVNSIHSNGRVATMDYNGTTAYHSLADGTEIDITNALTFGGWFQADAVSADSTLMSKWNGTGNQRSYMLQFINGSPDIARMHVSTDGSTIVSASHTEPIVAGTWYHIVGRFTSSTAVDIFVNGVKVSNTTSIPATIFSSSANFHIGTRAEITQFFDGEAALCFLCNGGAGAVQDALIVELYRRSAPFFQ